MKGSDLTRHERYGNIEPTPDEFNQLQLWEADDDLEGSRLLGLMGRIFILVVAVVLAFKHYWIALMVGMGITFAIRLLVARYFRHLQSKIEKDREARSNRLGSSAGMIT